MIFTPRIFGARALRFLLPALLGTTTLLATGCLKNNDVATPQDYSVIDDGLLKQYIVDQKITNAQRQPSGLYFVPDSVTATNTLATNGKTITVLYTGQLLNGNVFDSNMKAGGKPFSFVLGAGQVIAGWDIGVALMHKGDKARLLIPSALGYGAYGAGGGAIPPNAPLVFAVKVLDVK